MTESACLQVFYPGAFEGTWNVTGVLKEVTFPQGKRFLRVDVPGVTKSSMIAALPDVGAGMDSPVTYQCQYIRGADGVTADRCALAVQTETWVARVASGPSCALSDD